VTEAAQVTEVAGAVARVTLQTVADRVGVSRMTVSNAFSRPDQLSPALRSRILAAAEELGYSGPDPTARALARGSTGAVGVLLTDSLEYAFVDEVATRFLGALTAGLDPTGLALTLLSASSGPVQPARELPLDGAVVYSCLPRSASLDWLVRRRLPLVHVDQPPDAAHASINIDDRGGARAAARHLLDLGHRRIALLTANAVGPFGPLDVTAAGAALRDAHVAGQRLLGWLDELHAAGVEPVTVVVQPHAPDSTAFADQVLAGDEPPTAVLCFSDVMALTVLDAARRRGLDVPRDLSIVGFDDAPIAARIPPGLTTIAQDIDAKGRSAADLLVAEMAARRGIGTAARRGAGTATGSTEADDAERPRPHLVLPTSLVVRGSTAPPRRNRDLGH
jgi:DNA-binding LacI/PurR family transcriptional regulator